VPGAATAARAAPPATRHIAHRPAPPRSVILWGTSFAGGHALVMASRLGHRIKGVVAQVGVPGGGPTARDEGRQGCGWEGRAAQAGAAR
jgi:hypothetical protein